MRRISILAASIVATLFFSVPANANHGHRQGAKVVKMQKAHAGHSRKKIRRSNRQNSGYRRVERRSKRRIVKQRSERAYRKVSRAPVYASIVSCLNQKGFREGIDFRQNPGSSEYAGRLQVNGSTVDARGRLGEWESARSACGANAL